MNKDINVNDITVIDIKTNCDIIRWKGGDIKPRGYSSKTTEEQMYKLAYEHKCPIIVRAGFKGRWYLKGRGYSREILQQLMHRASNLKKKDKRPYFSNGTKCWLLDIN